VNICAKGINCGGEISKKMHTSIIKVYNSRYGKWEKNARVVLSWDGWLNSGMSKTVYTNAEGMAEIQHASRGKASIYVNGSLVDSFNSPGIKTVSI